VHQESSIRYLGVCYDLGRWAERRYDNSPMLRLIVSLALRLLAADATKKCPRCKRARYCGEECKQQALRSGRHKVECNRMRAAAGAVEQNSFRNGC
jgi:sulfatase maturation enzyme AslB (radical SAM superfamily)